MHERARAFRSIAAERYGLKLEVEELPKGTKTASDAAAAVGTTVDRIVKSMVMSVDADLVVVLTAGPNTVSPTKLASECGTETAEPASPELVRSALGWSIGGVPPFGYDTTVDQYLDPAILGRDRVWAGAGTPSAVFSIAIERLRDITGAAVVDVFEDSD